jgi:hypothetical protein
MAWKRGSLKPSRKPKEEGEGWRLSPTGKLEIADKGYFAWCHERHKAGKLVPLNSPVAGEYGVSLKLDLHHGPNPSGGARKANDAMVIPLTHGYHMEVDGAENGLERKLFAALAPLLYWQYLNRREDGEPPDPLEFARWCLERMIEDSADDE